MRNICKKAVLSVLCIIILTSSVVSAQNTTALPTELVGEYPYRQSETMVKYAPWFTMVYRSSYQSSRVGMNAGENCQVVGTIAFSDVNPDHVIAGFDTNGVAVTTDGGESWYYAQTGEGTHGCSTAFWHPSDENIVYRVGHAYNGSRYRSNILEKAEQRGMFRSEDCGRTWKKILDYSMPTRIGGTVAKFDSQGNLYALTNFGLFKSEDSGDTWVHLHEQQNWIVYDIAVSEDTNTILTATANGLNASFDGGKTWEFRNGKQFYGNVSSIDIDPLDEKHWIATFSRPYRCHAESFDYGKTWSLLDIKTTRPFKIKFGGVLEDGRRYIYAVGYDGSSSYKLSKDNGVTWSDAFVDTRNGNVNTGTPIEGMALSRKHPNIVWYAFGDGLNVSYDGGENFYNRGGGHGGQKCFTKIVTDDEGKIHFPGTDTGYFHTETPYKSGDMSFPVCSEPRMWGSAIAISPHNPKFMLLGGGEQGQKVMYRSYDKGETWQEIVGSLAEKSYSLIEFHTKDKNVIYTTNTTSFDGGLSWEKNSELITSVSPIDSDIVFSRGSYDAALGGALLKISYDKGKTWQDYLILKGEPDNTASFTIKHDLFEKDELWICQGNGSVLKKYSGDEVVFSYDFKPMLGKNIEFKCFAQDPRDREHLLVSIGRTNMDIGYGILESFDGGKTWKIVPGLPGNGMISMICFEEKTNDIFINGYTGIVIYDSKAYKEYCEKSEKK